MPAGLLPSSAMPPSFADALERMNELENAAEGIPAFLRLSNFSHAQLCRLTKKHLGKSPGEYVNMIRMRYARELVRGGELDCESVGELVGFGSYSHFCALFTRTFGVSPSHARRETLDSLRTV